MNFKFSSSVAFLLLTSLSAFAASGNGSGKHALSIGGGISSPSGVTSLLGENPAGLIYNTRFSLFGEGYTQGNDLDNLGFGGHLLLGNGTVAAGVGLRSSDGGNSRNNQVHFGVGAYANALKTAIGVGGTHDLDGGTSIDIGGIFDPMGKFRIGALVYDVTGDNIVVGAGVAFDINSNATIALDASSETDLEGLSLKPAIGVWVDKVQLTVGYGFDLDDGHGTRMDTGFTAGAGIFIGSSLHLQYYYQQLAQHELGLKYSF